MTIGTWLETCNNHNTKFQSKATTLLINLLIRLAPVLTSCKQAHLFTYSLIVFPWLGRCWLWHPLLLLKSKTFSPFVSCLACLGMSWKIHYFLLSIMLLLLLLAHRHRHLSLSLIQIKFLMKVLIFGSEFPSGTSSVWRGALFQRVKFQQNWKQQLRLNLANNISSWLNRPTHLGTWLQPPPSIHPKLLSQGTREV